MKNPVIVLMIALLGVPFAVAGEDPIQQREELMEETRDALKPSAPWPRVSATLTPRW